MRKKITSIAKILITWSIILFFCWVLFKNAGDYAKILTTLNNANYVYLTWAIVLAIGNLAIMTSVFRGNFQLFNQELTLGYLLPEVISYSFITISNPLGTSGAMAYMIKNLMKRGFTYVKSLFSLFATQLSINIGFLPILIATLFILDRDNQLNQYQILASQALLLLNIAIISGILFVVVLPKFSVKIAQIIGSIGNKIFFAITRKSLVNTDRISEYIHEIRRSSGRFDKSILRFLKTLLLSLLYHVINIVILLIIFVAFSYIPDIEQVVTLYGIIVLFSIVSPTPQGIGLVEGLAQLGAISIGMQSEPALVAILTYRIISLWLPALVGLFTFRKSRKQSVAVENS